MPTSWRCNTSISGPATSATASQSPETISARYSATNHGDVPFWRHSQTRNSFPAPDAIRDPTWDKQFTALLCAKKPSISSDSVAYSKRDQRVVYGEPLVALGSAPARTNSWTRYRSLCRREICYTQRSTGCREWRYLLRPNVSNCSFLRPRCITRRQQLLLRGILHLS